MDEKDVLLSTSTLARRLELEPQTLRVYRLTGRGPKFVKLGGPRGRCRYVWSDVQAWLAERSHQSTAELAAGKGAHRGRKRGLRS